MMSLQSQFNKFDKNIRLSNQDDVYKSARDKDDNITTEIKNAFKEAGWDIERTPVQGSFATHTAIKSINGDFDVDRGLVIREDDSESNPVVHKKVILAVLENRGFKNAKIKNPCVTADYSSLKLHIDYPVYREDDYGKMELAIGKVSSLEENRKWESAEPKGLIDWVNDITCHTRPFESLTNEEKAQFKRVVRYIKRWRDEKYTNRSARKHIYSIGLAIMLKKSFHPSIDENGTVNDLLALFGTVDELVDRQQFFTSKRHDKNCHDLKVDLPVTPYRDIFAKHGTTVGTELRNKFVLLRKKLNEAIDEEDLVKQCKIIQGEFGKDFPIPKETEGKSSSNVYNGAPGIVRPNQGA